MKLIIQISIFFLAALSANAQQTFVELVKDTVNNKFRFQRIEVRTYETLSDTLVTDRFPEKWLTAAELKTYQENVLRSIDERFGELSRLRKLAKEEFDVQVQYYDGLQGQGAYLALQKENVKTSLQGAWKFVERKTGAQKKDITITNLEFKKDATKLGTLTINDDLSLTLTGYFNFNLVFAQNANGIWVAERNGTTYILKK